MAKYEMDEAEEALGQKPDLDRVPGEDVHQVALNEFNNITKFTQEERMLALQDRRFVSIAGAQWEGDWAQQFENSIMVEVNKTAAGVEKIIGNYRSNRITVNFRPVGASASGDAAETLNGMFRADVYNSKGGQAFDNAFEEGVQGGYGAWRLTNEYCDEYDEDDDKQKIVIRAIVDADQSVYWDPNARLYDKSDAAYCFVVTAMSKEAFHDAFGNNRATAWPDSITKPYYDWFTPDVIKVAEYYRIQETEDTVYTLEHAATKETRKEYASDLEDGGLKALEVEGWKRVRTKKVKRRECRKWIMSGAEILIEPEGRLIAGGMIPVVPYYGKRYFIDNMERARGHVRLAKDPQRIYNSQISKLVETASLAPNERPIFTPEQIAGHEQTWADANIKRHPYSLINPMTDGNGNVIQNGPVSMITPPQLPPVLAALIQQTAADITELTNSDDQAAQVKSNISAEAMDIAATRTDDKVMMYMDNMRQSMQRCGEIYLAMAREIYFEEGREVETMDEDGQQGTATLSEPFTDAKGNYTIRNDIARGTYRVIADVTEATATRRDKTVKTLVNVAQIAGAADPELSAAALNTALLNMDGEGMNDLQDWVRARLVSQGVVKPTPEEQQQLQEAAQNQQPSAQDQALQAAAELQIAQAEKARVDAVKSQSETELNKAKTVETLAKAGRENDLAQQPVAPAAPAAPEQAPQKPQGFMARLFAKRKPAA